MAHSITLAAHSGTLVLNHAARQRSAPSRVLPSSSTQLRGAGQQQLLRQATPARQGARQGAPVRRGLVLALFEKFTERSIKGVMLAQEEARRLQSAEVTTEHIFLGLIAEDSGKNGFLGSGVTVEQARRVVEARVAKGRREPPKDLPFSRDAKKIFEAALSESRRMSMSFITPEHILLALLAVGDTTSRALFEGLSLDTDRLKAEAVKRLKIENEGEGRRKVVAASDRKKEGSSALDEFCRDLTAEAAQQRTDPVIGRQKEVVRISQILGRKKKNNPILLGEPGVGKTAIAEGLARAIVTKTNADGSQLPDFLVGKRLLQLDVGLLIAGAKERGELELRVTKLLQECRQEGNIILMIDEVHTLVGAGAVGRGGGGGGGLDISNLIKPALARGDLQCIGATTLDEHRKHIERDAALERRFQPVIVDEPTEEEALAILEGLQERYERHHRCVYSSEALAAAVALSSRYIADRHLPDKAIDLLDEAGSRVRIATYNARRAGAGREGLEAAATSYMELEQVIATKNEAVQDLLFEEATLLRQRELELKARLSGMPETAPVVPVVMADHIEQVVSAWTGVPVERMNQDDKDRLLTLGDALKHSVIGQDDAVHSTSRAIMRASSGLKNPDRPIATLLFSGPTGVGKTELTKRLADHYFGSEGAMIRLDMSEYMERHTVSKLIGAPPGYVGYGEGGKLTEAVRRKPFSVVLFDEIEKAHPDVFNVLLQVIEDGRLTDSQGRTVSFKNTLIILTSNVGSSVIAKGGATVGFQMATQGADPEADKYSRVRSLVLEELKAYFRPELLNRMDEVVVFRQLGPAQVRAIADLELAKTAERVRERGIALEVSTALMQRIVAEGYNEAMGARELRRAVVHLVDDPLSDALLRGEIRAGDTAVLDCDADTGRTVVLNRAQLGSNNIVTADLEIVYSSAAA
ncbi:hypothetical protein ABPG77_011510 [Micractinium sp. CCAP 211/92]